MAKITSMTSKWQNTSKNDANALKLAENKALHDCLCWMTKKLKNHLIIMLISIIMLIKKSHRLNFRRWPWMIKIVPEMDYLVKITPKRGITLVPSWYIIFDLDIEILTLKFMKKTTRWPFSERAHPKMNSTPSNYFKNDSVPVKTHTQNELLTCCYLYFIKIIFSHLTLELPFDLEI